MSDGGTAMWSLGLHKHFMIFEVLDELIQQFLVQTLWLLLDNSIFCFEDIRVGKLLHFGSFFQWLIILAAKNVSLISHMNFVDFCFPLLFFMLVSSSVSSGRSQMTESISSSNSSNPAKLSGGLQFIFSREGMNKIFCSSWWEITLLILKNWPPHSPLSLPPTVLQSFSAAD